MKRRTLLLVSATVVVLAAALVLTSLSAKAQMSQRRGRGPARLLCNIEGLWAEVTFTARVDDAKLIELRKNFQKAWDKRKAATASMGSPEEMETTLSPILDELMAGVKEKLTEEESGALSSWMEEQARVKEIVARMRERRMRPRESGAEE